MEKSPVTSMIINGRRRLLYTMPDRTQVVQEYDPKSHQLLLRRIKRPAEIKQTGWLYQIGQAPPKEGELLLTSSTAPIFIRKDTPKAYQFRIRNLPYPYQVYSVEVDEQKQQLVIKTTNKKYYKRFNIPDLQRQGLKLHPEEVSFKHGNNTLVVSYNKPSVILQQQSKIRQQLQKLNLKKCKQGDIQCVQQ